MTVHLTEPLGAMTQIAVHAAGPQLSVLTTDRVAPGRGAPVRIAVDVERLHLFCAETGARLPSR